jgi:hypothetical protein
MGSIIALDGNDPAKMYSQRGGGIRGTPASIPAVTFQNARRKVFLRMVQASSCGIGAQEIHGILDGRKYQNLHSLAL